MTDRRRYLTIAGVLLAALVAVALIAVPGSPIHRKTTLGLDLQGGLEVVLQAEPPQNQPNYKITDEDMTRSVSIMRNRIDKLGVSEPEIRKQSGREIVIQLAGIHDPEEAAKLIGKTAQLQFYDLEADIAPPTRHRGRAAGAESVVVPRSGARAVAGHGQGEPVVPLQEQAEGRRAGHVEEGAARVA